MNNLEPVTKRDHLEPRAKIGDVVIIKNGGDVIQVKVVNARWGDGTYSQWRYYFRRTEHEVIEVMFFEEDILKNLTTNTDYTGNDEQQSPKRFVMANECLIHPGTPGHNC